MAVVKPFCQTHHKLTLLERRRVTQRFWSKGRNRELFFVSAPLQYGKTSAVISALEGRNYLYIRLDPCLNDGPRFCTHVINCLHRFDATIPTDKTTEEDMLLAVGTAAGLDALVFDDLQFCGGEAAMALLERIYRLHGSRIQMIFISRDALPERFVCCGITTVTEETLAFSDTEIKKLAEQNRLRISGAHARQLSEQSAGCIGFIEEELRLGDRFAAKSGLPVTLYACIEQLLSASLPDPAISLLSEFAAADELPPVMGQDYEVFSRRSGLIRGTALHPLLKRYLQSVSGCGHTAYRLLLSNNAFLSALNYAVAAGNREDVGAALRHFLTRDFIVPASALERIDALFGRAASADEAVNFFLNLYALKCGGTKHIASLLSMGAQYTGCQVNLKAHVFTSPYPHINAEYGFCVGADERLIQCGILCDDLRFSEALELLRQARGTYENAAQAAYFCLLIDALRNLYMYTAAETELDAFRHWTDRVPEYHSVFENFHAKLLILGGDQSAAEEWLSVRCIPLTAQVDRGNLDHILIDALAFIVIGEAQAVPVRLRNAADFAQTHGLHPALIECYALLAIAHRENWQTDTAMAYMEKALALAERYRKPAIIGRLGKDAAYLIERCYLRSRKKGDDNEIARKLLLHLKDKKARGGLSAKDGNVCLSARQKEILAMLNESYTYAQIAEAANIKITTVRDHIKKLYEKLEVRNSTDAIVKAKENQLL